MAVVRVPEAKVALSTASVYPEATPAAFELAARLGYDGVEVMVWTDPVSQDPEALKRLSDYHRVPILAVHAPCLIITQRVWGTDPWAKLVRARNAAEHVGAKTVVVHPPFRWQRDYARGFVIGVAELESEFGVQVAQRGLWREAIYRWEKATELDPSYAAAYNDLAVAYEHEGQLDKARKAYEKALEVEPNNAQIRQNYELFKEINDRASQKDK